MWSAKKLHVQRCYEIYHFSRVSSIDTFHTLDSVCDIGPCIGPSWYMT